MNQPWMDTYLEGLVNRDAYVRVVTANTRPREYHRKVDLLSLRELTVHFDLDPASAALRVLATSIRSPTRRASQIVKYWMLLGREMRLMSRSLRCVQAVQAAALVEAVGAIDVVHAHSLDMAYDFIPVLSEKRIPLVVTFHGLKPKGIPQTPPHRRRAVLQYASRVLVNTVASKAEFTDEGIQESSIAVIPQGIPLEDFPFVPRAAPKKGEEIRLLTVGRYHREKGQEYALLALRRLVDAAYRIHWDFVGVGPELDRYKRLADRLGVTKYVTFHLALNHEQLLKLYKESHLFVLTSTAGRRSNEWVETQGVVLQEAQAVGCIPIASAVGGIPECITNGHDGVLIKDSSHRQIASTITELLESPEKWNVLQRNGRRNVEQRFSSDVVGSQTFEALMRSIPRL
jgi:glycosyltransferase involved in cell wall biosynthesis